MVVHVNGGWDGIISTIWCLLVVSGLEIECFVADNGNLGLGSLMRDP
jgi:hypothetical protein